MGTPVQRDDHAQPRLRLPHGVVETVARWSGALSRLAGAGAGTSLPGVILEKGDPDFVARRAAELSDGMTIGIGGWRIDTGIVSDRSIRERAGRAQR